MKFVVIYAARTDLMAAVPPERQQEVYAAVFRWFQENEAAFADGGAELQGPETATTVKGGDAGGERIVVDGPFSEAKEQIGGISIVDLPDLDAAIALAKTWPMLELPGNSVEVRPIVEDYSQFEG